MRRGLRQYDLPHVVMTFSAILSLAILRDDFQRLDRAGIAQFLGRMQQPDGRHVHHHVRL